MPLENSNIQLENGGELQISLYLSCEDQIKSPQYCGTYVKGIL